MLLIISMMLKLKKHFILKTLQDLGINAFKKIKIMYKELPMESNGIITFNLKHPFGFIQFWKLLVLELCFILETLMVPSVLLEVDNGLKNSTGQLLNHGHLGWPEQQNLLEGMLLNMMDWTSSPYTVLDTWLHNGLENQLQQWSLTGSKTNHGMSCQTKHQVLNQLNNLSNEIKS